MWCSIQCVGSTHDSTAFAASSLAEALRDENHPFTKSSAWIAGDDAYSGCAAVMHNNMLTPYKGRNLDVWSDAFNFWQSSCRIVVECTLGELIARWGIMWRKLRMDIGFASEVIEYVAAFTTCAWSSATPSSRAPSTAPSCTRGT